MLYCQDKTVTLGVTGSIAIYRSCDLVRALRKDGAEVQVIMTHHASRLISPQTFRALSGHPVRGEMFGDDRGYEHLPIGGENDLLLIAPATGNFLGKAAAGIADDLLSSTFLTATPERTVIVPAMNYRMYGHPAVVANLSTLRSRGHIVMDADCGELACGDTGQGRLPPLSHILSEVRSCLSLQDLAGKTVLITAGPTREPLDPVRYLSNHSSGNMGYALASEARRRGAHVILISGPVHLEPPYGVHMMRIMTAKEMLQAARQVSGNADIIICSAAVSDFRPTRPAISKLKKNRGSHLTLALEQTTDILKELSAKRTAGQTVVGFALETDDLLTFARQKLEAKSLDLVVGNGADALGATESTVTLVTRDNKAIALPRQDKQTSARDIFDQILFLRKESSKTRKRK